MCVCVCVCDIVIQKLYPFTWGHSLFNTTKHITLLLVVQSLLHRNLRYNFAPCKRGICHNVLRHLVLTRQCLRKYVIQP